MTNETHNSEALDGMPIQEKGINMVEKEKKTKKKKKGKKSGSI